LPALGEFIVRLLSGLLKEISSPPSPQLLHPTKFSMLQDPCCRPWARWLCGPAVGWRTRRPTSPGWPPTGSVADRNRNFLLSGTGTVTCQKVKSGTGTVIKCNHKSSHRRSRYKILYLISFIKKICSFTFYKNFEETY
jgi:hypothetical protein